jgi:hypothetical protein
MNEIPGLIKGEFGFEGTVKVNAWSDFQISSKISDGSCRLSIGGDMVIDEPIIEEIHLNAYNYLIENQEEIKKTMLEYLLNSYPDLQEQYGYEGDEKTEFMPHVTTSEEFKPLIQISNIHLMNVAKDGAAYVGYEFGCKWDDEHGIGFMTHKNRIIDLGMADTSFLTWVARKDLEPQDESVKVSIEKNVNPVEMKEKPWWKFW